MRTCPLGEVNIKNVYFTSSFERFKKFVDYSRRSLILVDIYQIPSYILIRLEGDIRSRLSLARHEGEVYVVYARSLNHVPCLVRQLIEEAI